jgi:hypothetical protein
MFDLLRIATSSKDRTEAVVVRRLAGGAHGRKTGLDQLGQAAHALITLLTSQST